MNAPVPSMRLTPGKETVLASVVDGYEPFVLADIAAAADTPVVFVARDANRLPAISAGLRFRIPGLPVLELPAWDCLPYDRVGPSASVAAQRVEAMNGLARLLEAPHRAVILTTANALLQRMPPVEAMRAGGLSARAGERVEMEALVRELEANGFERESTVREPGSYAVRGGILDVYAPGADEPLRIDFFGDEIESIRTFDPTTQRSTGDARALELTAMSEVTLTPDTVRRFRTGYLSTFGADTRGDALYEAVTSGRRFAGLEHWLPLFYGELATLFDYTADWPLVLDHLTSESLVERGKQVLDHYEARARARDQRLKDQGSPYKPMEPPSLYLDPDEIRRLVEARGHASMTPFAVPPRQMTRVVDARSVRGRTFRAERERGDANVFEAAVEHIAAKRAEKRVLVAAWSEGSLDRLGEVLEDHGLARLSPVADGGQLDALPANAVGSAVLPVEEGFETPDLCIVSEQDILGERLVRRRRKRASDFISEVSSLEEGDVVVHVEHGIGRFLGLRTVAAAGAPHDCVEIEYAAASKLLLPVENIELLSRYGGDTTEVALDRLGGGAWQARKAKLKKRLLDMAGDLIRIAAERATRQAPSLQAPEGLYDEFSTRFPYDPTDDQQNAIDAVLEDLAKGSPMDRLVCGDVGFGKTEVALRAAFVAAMNGVQVAVVVPTTLLSRQHFATFADRFRGFPIKVVQASRIAGPKGLAEAKKAVADGSADIVVGTHALLGKGIEFRNLGVLIVDEEQRFGVKHKERLKELKSDVHVLTLSATPIPRTLQLALTGVRDLSMIATAPVDRLAVRTFVAPFDQMAIRETLLREHYRGGQSYYVCPRVSDLGEIKAFLDENVPELRAIVAHGQMPPTELDDIMTAFYEGKFDVLLSTTIVESGLDVPSANTLVIHRADMFGLAQLYQIRGRIGRSKLRAFALLTLPVNKTLTKQADRRLKVLSALDTLGAGFQLASHDLDIRGGGNLLGEEQSGHIREVGYELYQQMLEEAVAEMKGEAVGDGAWSPQINVGTTVMIPESYVEDLQLRLQLYRRLADLTEPKEIDAFGAELIDRFGGPLPVEVEHLLKVVYVKALCRRANVEKLDAGPKGVVVQFRGGEFANPAALVGFIGKQGSAAKIRPDQSVVVVRDWPTPEKRLAGSAVLMTQLAKMAEPDGAA